MTLLDLAYQTEGAQFLAGRKTALLADDPGLGKTRQAIKACDEARDLKVLVICPASVVENWKREILKWRRGDWRAAVFSYDLSVARYRASIMRDEFDRIIIDEAHFLKEITARRTRAIYGFNQNFDISDAHSIIARGQSTTLLTGTPMPNYPNELYPHLRALHSSAIVSGISGKPYTYAEFEARYCTQGFNGMGWTVNGSQREDELHAKLGTFMLRRRKSDVLKQLPPINFTELWLEGDVAGLETPEADRIREVLSMKGVDGLRTLAANGSVSTLRRLTGTIKALPAANWINDWLDGAPKDKKLVVFFHHYDVGEALYDKLHTRGVRVHGAMKQVERQRSVDRFQKDPSVRVFMGQITAAGVGITLTAASDLLFVESSWVPAEVQQAAMRIHRIGQTEPCLVRFAMIADSIDEQIQRALMRKMESIGKVVDGQEFDAERGVFA